MITPSQPLCYWNEKIEQKLSKQKVTTTKEDPSVLITKLGPNSIVQMKKAVFILKMTSRSLWTRIKNFDLEIICHFLKPKLILIVKQILDRNFQFWNILQVQYVETLDVSQMPVQQQARSKKKKHRSDFSIKLTDLLESDYESWVSLRQ